jgi:hypothetical protein
MVLVFNILDLSKVLTSAWLIVQWSLFFDISNLSHTSDPGFVHYAMVIVSAIFDLSHRSNPSWLILQWSLFLIFLTFPVVLTLA